MIDLNEEIDSRQSTYREKLLEHLFVSEVLQASWLSRQVDIEVLRAEVDASGYDIVLSRGNVIRHIQLKSTRKGSTTAKQSVNVKLADKAAGCVVLIIYQEDIDNSRIRLEYAFLGGGPSEKLVLENYGVAKHTKANSLGIKAERPNIRSVPMKEFKSVDGGISGLLQRLFDIPSNSREGK